MKKPVIIITITALYLLFFYASPHIGVPDEVIIAMSFLSPVVVIYMVYVILKYGKPSGHKFDERFYDDYNYRRSDI